jgi:hypothetical protein
MAEPENAPWRALLTWSLAAFHAALLLTAVIALLYSRGGLGSLLGSLNTALGLGLYALLWLTTWWTTRRALAGLPWSTLGQPLLLLGRLGRIALWGAANGGLFFLALLALIVTNGLLTIAAGARFAPDVLPGLLAVSLAGAAVAAALGAVLAALFVLLDAALLALARRLAPDP